MLVLRLKFEILNVEFYSTILYNSSNKQGVVPFIIGTYPDGSYKFCLRTFAILLDPNYLLYSVYISNWAELLNSLNPGSTYIPIRTECSKM